MIVKGDRYVKAGKNNVGNHRTANSADRAKICMRGGARKGAGRKSVDKDAKRVVITATVDAETQAKLKALAQTKQHGNASQIVEVALLQYFDSLSS
jgi:hypothetical protein